MGGAHTRAESYEKPRLPAHRMKEASSPLHVRAVWRRYVGEVMRHSINAIAAPLVIALAFVTTAAEAEVLVPTPQLDLKTLVQLVTRRSTAVATENIAALAAKSEARQAHLLGNPILDATWGTIPIGSTNPPGDAAPLANIPNYSVGLSYTVLLGKRGPRQERAHALVEGAAASVEAVARANALDLARVFGTLAASSLKVEGLRHQVVESRDLIALAKARLDTGFGSPLDVDRLEIELHRVEQEVAATEGEELVQLAQCTEIVRERCAPFASSAEARRFVEVWVDHADRAGGNVEQRPDVRALDAYRRAAGAEADLGHAQAIPDPQLRVGYMRDLHTSAGSQENSFSLGVTLPLPLFDHGQAVAQGAEERQDRLRDLRSTIVGTSSIHAAALREALRIQERRRDSLEGVILPRARGVIAELTRVVNNRLLPLTDVIQARRTLNELFIQESDTYGDLFARAVDLLEEIPEAPTAERKP
jgi:outer membrane protein, heavy metal efflux system